ncbi:MAG: hypothetical protein WCO25_04930 [Candidatus Uhrbacteria bacterium]
MMDRYVPPEVIAAAEREAVKRRFSEKSRYFDPELFMEGYDAMSAEFDAANRNRRRTQLTNRYFDAFAPVDDEEIADSQFEDRFCMRAPERIISEEDGAREGGVAKLFDSVRARMSMSRYGTMWQQGPSRVFDLPSGNFIEVAALGRQDVIGSHAFSACTAIVARKEAKTFMAHILGSNTDDLNKTLDAIRALGYSQDRTRLFSPFWTEPDGTTMDSWNHRLEKIADERSLQIDFFPYIGYSVHNPDDIRHTTILVGRDALWSVGTDFKTTYKQTKHGTVAQQRTIIRGLTYRDYE